MSILPNNLIFAFGILILGAMALGLKAFEGDPVSVYDIGFTGKLFSVPDLNLKKAELFRELTSYERMSKIRDPFRFSKRKSDSADKITLENSFRVEEIELSAIWRQGDITLILLNDRIYEVGDDVGNARIEEVQDNGVLLSHPGGRSLVEVGNSLTFEFPAVEEKLKRFTRNEF